MHCNRFAKSRAGWLVLSALVILTLGLIVASAVPAHATAGGEANLKIPDLGSVHVAGMGGRTLLMFGLVVCVLGLVFGLVIYNQLKNMAVHESMREISELIYETCKTYLITQGKFILLLEVFVGIVAGPLGAHFVSAGGGMMARARVVRIANMIRVGAGGIYMQIEAVGPGAGSEYTLRGRGATNVTHAYKQDGGSGLHFVLAIQGKWYD